MGITRDLADAAATGDFGGDAISGGGAAFSNITFSLPSDYEFSGTDIQQGSLVFPPMHGIVLIRSDNDDLDDTFINSALSDLTLNPLGGIYHSTLQSRFGQSSILFGTDKLIEFLNSDFDYNKSWTFESFMYLTSSSNQGLLSNGLVGETTGISFGYYNGTFQFGYNGPNINTGISVPAYNTWFHMAWTFDVVTRKVGLYINGQYRWSSNGLGIFNTSPNTFKLGWGFGTSGGSWTGPFYFTGYMDDIRISSTVQYTDDFVIPDSPFSSEGTGTALTTNESHLNLSYISRINDINFEYEEPTNTSIKTLVSWDGRNTWEYHNGTSWQVTTLNDIEINGMSISALQTALRGYQVTSEQYLDLAFGLSTTDELATPSIDSVLIQYGEPTSAFPTSSVERITFSNASYYDITDVNIVDGSIVVDVVNAVPTMTSNTAPSGVASASSVFSSAYQPWKAFDDSADFAIEDDAWASSSAPTEVSPQWLQYQFPVQTNVTYYKVVNRNYSTGIDSPNSWTFQGSNDGLNWDILHTVTNDTNNTAGAERNFSFSNTTKYLYYRLHITARNGADPFVAVEELGMFSLSGDMATTNESNLDLNFISSINGVKFTYNQPTNTDIKTLVSFDERQNWKKWNSSTQLWETVLIEDIGTQGNTVAEIEGALQGYQVGPTDVYLDFALGLSTTDSLVTPEIDAITIQYVTSSASRFEKVDVLPEWTEKDEGRIVYQTNTKKINFGTDEGWQQIQTIDGGNYPTDGLTAEYLFENDYANFTEDTSGLNNHATNSGSSLILDLGKVGSSVYLTSNSYFSVPTDDIITSDYSISMWLKVNDYTANDGIIAFGNLSTAHTNIEINIVSSELRYSLDSFSTVGSIAIDTTWETEYKHLVFTLDATGLIAKTYLNGVEVISVNPTAINIAGTITRFGIYYSTSNGLTGNLDQVRVYNRVLNTTEISQLYNSGNGI